VFDLSSPARAIWTPGNLTPKTLACDFSPTVEEILGRPRSTFDVAGLVQPLSDIQARRPELGKKHNATPNEERDENRG